MRRTGRQAGDILQRAMVGEIRPRTLRAYRPMLARPAAGAPTAAPCSLDWLARSRAYEAAHPADVFAVSLNAGFSHADIDGWAPPCWSPARATAAHQAFAESIGDRTWDARFEVPNRYLSVDEAAARARDWPADAARPLVIADYSDNPAAVPAAMRPPCCAPCSRPACASPASDP